MNPLLSQQMNTRAVNKQMALYLAGSSDAYQNFKRTQEIKSFYPNDFHYYNDTFYIRHDRNIDEIQKMKQLIKKDILKPGMLIYNTWNAFYPSYILNHHFTVYLEIISMIFSQTGHQEVKQVLEKGKSLTQLGCYCQKIVSTQFGKLLDNHQPKINKNGEIQMVQNNFYLDKHVSLYYHTACFICESDWGKVLAFVKLRNQSGQINEGINIKDFGERVSSEYLQIGYNFNKVKPFLLIKVSNQMKVKLINNVSYFNEFNLSLLDLKKSLHITIKYTQMRTQFKTLPNSKQERRIGTYQAVGVRIIDAFSRLVCFSELNRAMFNNKQIIALLGPLLDINHHMMLESVIRLRECCGGFGYLQVAGHGSSIQRVAFRASEAFISQIPDNTQILKRLHYYSSSDEMEYVFGKQLTRQNVFTHEKIFAMFISVCVNMRKSMDLMRKQIYLRHFMYQASIQLIKLNQIFSRLKPDSIWLMSLTYSCVSYVLQNSEYLNWKLLENVLQKEQYFRGLTQFKNNLLNKMINRISEIEQILQVGHLRNVILGRQNQKEFYDQVLETSKKNLRNSEQFVDYVRKPIIQFLAENNAKL